MLLQGLQMLCSLNADYPDEVDRDPSAVKVTTPRVQYRSVLWVADVMDRTLALQ